MNRWPSRHLLIVTGGVALLLGGALSALGVFLYGREMMPNLLAGIAGTAVDVAVAALIIDRLRSRHQRREWAFAYEALAKRLAETFVDLMRLLDTTGTARALQANISRYSQFVQKAHLHLADLRSHIEGAATALDSRTHEQYRRIERRLSWCLLQLQDPPSRPGYQRNLLTLMCETATPAFALIMSDGNHRPELAAAELAIKRAREADSEGTPGNDPLWGRLSAQELLLQELGDSERPIYSIGQDVDNDFSIPYFMIDYLLLKSATLESVL